jgi:TPP-dependent pyruvate/acetoin dehydrogenase alpha subunit
MRPADLLRRMLLIRRFEAALAARPDRGFQLFSSGQEAVAVGLCAALAERDQLLCSGRSIAPALARGLDPGAVMAELLGREAGPCAGRAGRGHLAEPARGFFGAHAVVAGNISIAAGVALAMQAQGQGGLVACLFGDGACAAGALHETLNIAALWRLPLLLVCDNNGYSISSPREAMLAPARLSDLARPFGLVGETVDGMDVLAVQEAATRLAGGIRAGGGPVLLECLSGRLLPHSTGTRETRPAAELAALRQRCPIATLAARLRAEAGLDEAAMETEVAAEIAAALAFAEASAMPAAATVLQHVG